MRSGWRGTFKANYDPISLVMQVGTGWWLSRLHKHQPLAGHCSAVLCCYLQHTHSSFLYNTIANSTWIRPKACLRTFQFFWTKVYREFVRRGAEWCLNPSSGVAGGSAVIFTPTDDVLTQKTVVIILVQRWVLTCGALFLVFLIISEFCRNPESIQLLCTEVISKK